MEYTGETPNVESSEVLMQAAVQGALRRHAADYEARILNLRYGAVSHGAAESRRPARAAERGLAQADAALPKELQRLNKSIAAELVPKRGRQSQGTARARGSRAIGTIRALASGTRAQIAGGTAAVPWYIGHEWGSIRSSSSRRSSPRATRSTPR